MWAVLPNNIVEQVCHVPIRKGCGNYLWWKHLAKGRFSIKEAWKQVHQGVMIHHLMTDIRCRVLTPTMSIFRWHLPHNIVPINERLWRKGILMLSKCQCCSQVETLEHVFISGPKADEVW